MGDGENQESEAEVIRRYKRDPQSWEEAKTNEVREQLGYYRRPTNPDSNISRLFTTAKARDLVT